VFFLGNFIQALAQLINLILSFYIWVVIIRALITWVNPDPYNPIVQILHKLTEPVFYQIRRRLPFSTGGMDFTPMIVILLILFLQTFLVQSLIELGRRIH